MIRNRDEKVREIRNDDTQKVNPTNPMVLMKNRSQVTAKGLFILLILNHKRILRPSLFHPTVTMLFKERILTLCIQLYPSKQMNNSSAFCYKLPSSTTTTSTTTTTTPQSILILTGTRPVSFSDGGRARLEADTK